jgi:hypothetical protein
VESWEAPLVRLGGGQVLLRGSALLDVLRALDAAQLVARRDGLPPPRQWVWLRAQVAAECERIPPARTAPAGSADRMGSAPAAVFEIVDTDLIGTREVARMLGCQPRNVRDLHAREVLASGRLVGGRLLFERTEVEAEAQRRAEDRETRRSA